MRRRTRRLTKTDGVRNLARGRGRRRAPIDLDPGKFRRLGKTLVEDIAKFLATIASREVNPGRSPREVRKLLKGGRRFPAEGTDPSKLLREAAELVLDNSLLTGHPRFWGYISSSGSPIGALGDLLASSVNPNVGSFQLGPLATEMESQVIRWTAELIGYPTSTGGILVSGGNMANFVCFLAARRSSVPWNVRSEGLAAKSVGRFSVYTSAETHTWIQKAADLFGLGTESIRWIPVDSNLRMDVEELRRRILEDRAQGCVPLMVVGTAGTVGTGGVDPLREIAALCRQQKIWFHIDGAYGAPAAILKDAPEDLRAIGDADSVAVDPHKWLYAPLEAGCALVKNPQNLLDTFSYRPPYYTFDGTDEDVPTNYYERGLQNSRSFRALKIWLGMRQVGLNGYRRMISDDVRLAEHLFECIGRYPELEACSLGLSIVTFRFAPSGVDRSESGTEYLNKLNTDILATLQKQGKAFCSSTLIGKKFVIRACIVNFRTDVEDVELLPAMVAEIGGKIHTPDRSVVSARTPHRPAIRG